MSGKTLVLPPQPKLEGTNRLNVKDPNGIYYVKEMINLLKTKESGWLQYSYPKPEGSVVFTKHSYFKKVKMGNSYLVVGSGYYLE
jgi:signal transduction histidine kinase